MRDGLGLILVAVGVVWTLMTLDKLGLVIAFAGVTLLAVGVIQPRAPRPGGHDQEPPIF